MGVVFLLLVFLFLIYIFWRWISSDSSTPTENQVSPQLPTPAESTPPPTKKEYLPFKRRASVMTNAEKKYFFELQEKYGEAYYIFPQVNLDKIIEVTDRSNFYQYFNKINRKSVDFVLAEKTTLETFKAIELDDYTHQWPSRIQRDNFVNSIFQEIGLLLKRE